MNDLAESHHLDLETAEILAEMAEAALPDRTSLSVHEARLQMEAGNLVWNTPLPEMAEARDFEIVGPLGSIPMRLLRPNETTSDGAIVYLHGGGWVLGSLQSHHRLMRLLAIESGAAVIGVDYRLAPEHPFPSPLNDCLAAVHWVQTNAASLNLNPESIILAGDSAVPISPLPVFSNAVTGVTPCRSVRRFSTAAIGRDSAPSRTSSSVAAGTV